MICVIIERECLPCGRRLRITVHEDGSYEGGHYFGTLKIPKESLENASIVRTSPNFRGEKNGMVLIEYWECDECFSKGGR